MRRLIIMAAIAVTTAAFPAKADPTDRADYFQKLSTSNAATSYAYASGRIHKKSSRTAHRRHHRTVAVASVRRSAPRQVSRPQPSEAGHSTSSVVAEARRYLGTNPTNRRSLWCGAFMDLVLRRTGHPGGGNLARAYARYGTRVSGPQVGALAVMSRGHGGGHVGVVSGIDSAGNVIVVSGNHNNTVAEAAYPRSRIFAYVVPN